MSGPGRPNSNRPHVRAEIEVRIFDAARELFRALPYDEVTTHSIARHAAVASGTVFRYASTKPELLLMVYNAAFRERVAHGLDALAEARGDDARSDATAQIMALVSPVVAESLGDENVATYQREVLFGPADRYRGEALEIVAGLRGAIAAALADAWRERHGSSPPDPEIAARTVSTSLHMTLVRAAHRSTGGAAEVLTDLAAQVELVTRGYLAARP
ncbi:helix-turn-helix domain-containing protein [Rhodococcus sp. HNM0569]|uniref:TetR/AcrR family transcriptional regulator n=1 Tax=Rhodococcus sp. HNM0569 TaxID=2716340 RepID=UPI00146CBDC5|nr:helix-turn-helix domain-containing protein [Rhodococcus sp. HNM0569]NLU83769.1 helix-turn-helix transcriptional regulator [Rhodococcus sp. HNM0569]